MLKKTSLFSAFVGCVFGLAVALPAHAASANFNGNWSLVATVTQDACGLGTQGKKLTVPMTIKQSGSKATISLSISGIGLKYKGSVRANKLTGSGSYNYSGIKISSSMNATINRGNKKITVPATKLNLKSASVSCFIKFKGTAKKV